MSEDELALERLLPYVAAAIEAQEDLHVQDQLNAAWVRGWTSLRFEPSALCPVVVVTVGGRDLCEVSLSRLVDLDE